jgi:putative ABC transport system ATP-binding protein/lipoprotein-releasing system ATP-binding protein
MELKEVSKVYTLGENVIKAVDGASLRVEKGEFISIVGHSGSGKTTLLSIIGGMLGPSTGSMLFEGSDVYSLGEDGLSEYRAERIGFVFQFASLLPVLTARENLLVPTLFGKKRGGDKARMAEESLRLVGLGDKVNAYPSQLSGGQQRRVAIARALMNDPDVMLADEPTGDLDEETEAEVMGLFRKINSEQGKTFILVTHSSELARAAGRRLRMTHGRLEEF